ncbi:hypothetical protein EVAR_86253_1 [Eumeta japonica]|uniref:Uncharacterized protein n=1 Tax=Eumeta variegata TaxID=151549 RepID=A0A4C1UD54_EUMVA|nr:hypothetical protein EVAR_86253_1 [Eumeta japonica]
MGVGTGRRTYILPHARASSRRGHDPDGSSGNGPYLMDPLVGIVPEPSRRPTRGRAVIACAAGRWRGIRRVVGARRGEEAQLKPHTQPTAGGRTLVDADRIKAARIGDPRRRRSNRARPPTADQAIHASDGSSQGSTCQRAVSFNLLVLSHPGSRCQSGAYVGPPAGARVTAHALSVGWGGHRVVKRWLTRAGGRALLDRRTQTTAARRKPMNAEHVEVAPTGDSAAAPEAARVSEQLSSSSSGPRQGGLSDRRGAPRSIGSQLE